MTTVPYSYKKNDMDDKEIQIDLKWFDDLLDKANGTQLDFFDDLVDKQNLYYGNTSAATISTIASGNTWPYISTGTGNYKITGTGTGNLNLGLSFNDQWDFNHKQSLSVRGDAEFDGDIKLKGKSLSETLDKIEQRLAILHPNEKLEDKWLELKKLGDAYRALEKDIIEKEKIWETLKK